MTPRETLVAFLQKYHDDVLACEARAVAAMDQGDSQTYTACMKEKAEKMAAILQEAQPYMDGLDEDSHETVYHALHRFSNSARMGLRVNSPFYWSALLWNDDYKPGDTDNLQLFINELKNTSSPEA